MDFASPVAFLFQAFGHGSGAVAPQQRKRWWWRRRRRRRQRELAVTELWFSAFLAQSRDTVSVSSLSPVTGNTSPSSGEFELQRYIWGHFQP
ncbi:uncharacterized protein isoform X5 [Macaca fascicularis]|uniref:uncharacterized protein isoform X5 n=1 Tax=Macaca fascicularis TaxID=9541 RepID=UPI003D15C3CA